MPEVGCEALFSSKGSKTLPYGNARVARRYPGNFETMKGWMDALKIASCIVIDAEFDGSNLGDDFLHHFDEICKNVEN